MLFLTKLAHPSALWIFGTRGTILCVDLLDNACSYADTQKVVLSIVSLRSGARKKYHRIHKLCMSFKASLARGRFGRAKL